MSVATSNVNINFDTFNSLVGQLNFVLNALDQIIVTTAANTIGGSTTGNATILGTFSSNIVAVIGTLTGGTVTTPAPLLISSNVISNGSLSLFNSNVTINSANTLISSNVTNINGNTFTISAVTSFSNALNISGVTTVKNTFSSNSAVTLGNNQFNVTSNAFLNSSNVTISGGLVNITSNVIVTGANVNISSATDITANLIVTGTSNFSNTVINGTVLPGTANTLGSGGNRFNSFEQNTDIMVLTANLISGNTGNLVSLTTNNLIINSIATFVTASNTNVGANVTAPQTIISLPIANYRGGSLTMTSTSLLGDVQIETIIFAQNTTNVYYTTSDILFSNTQLHVSNAAISGANVNITITQNVANLNIKLVGQLIGV